MRLRDFQKEVGNISTTESLLALDRNATACKQIDWRTTKIFETEGARANNPFLKLRASLNDSVGIDSARIHRQLDLLLAKDGDFTAPRRKIMHQALDEMIRAAGDDDPEDEDEIESDSDSEEAEIISDEEEPEEGTDEDFQRLNDAVENFARVASRSRVSDARSVAADSDEAVYHRYLPRPEQLCSDALIDLQNTLYSKQRNPAAMEFWRGLYFQISAQPTGTKVGDVKRATLIPLLRRLHENRIN